MCVYVCSISATMLTCRTPPQPSPSQHKVQLHIDGVIREAPVSYTYNENPHISSIQPKNSFIRSVLQPNFSDLTCAWSWGLTGRVHKYAFNSKVFVCVCVHSGGSTVTVHGFYLHSALQPQMVLTAATEGKLFQVVSVLYTAHKECRDIKYLSSHVTCMLVSLTPLNSEADLLIWEIKEAIFQNCTWKKQSKCSLYDYHF